MIEINVMIIAYNSPDDPGSGNGGGSNSNEAPGEQENSGTIILDATCAPQNISYPQDVNLLNEARENARRDFGYVEYLLSEGTELSEKRCQRYEVLWQVYEQQRYNVHTVPNRIVSISQPYVRPIVRGKAAAPAEFHAVLCSKTPRYFNGGLMSRH